VLDFSGFISAELFTVYESSSPNPNVCDNGIVVRYTLESRHVFDEYNKSDLAKKLRNDAIEKFGKKFSAQRRVLQSGDILYK
jgi:hypothetical protein